MGDILKVLTEASLDSVFILTGLALIVLAIIGSISGKFELGKGGRIAGGIAGAGLICAGLWMHASHGLKIVSLAVSTPQSNYEGPAPSI
jgi:hypothetical protein